MPEGKRYRAFSAELKELFGGRVHRVPVDGGFTCPNRDGTIGRGGCIFCGGEGSGAAGILRGRSITDQIEAGKEAVSRRYRVSRFLAYFQAYSNTHAPVEHLQALYDEALAVPGVVGLMVGTRPDCLPPPVLDLLAAYHEKTYFWLELGLQSPHDRTLDLIGRGHTAATFYRAVRQAKEHGIRVCAHLILGLPGETREEMLAGASFLNDLGVDGVKIHLLHVMRGTGLAQMYERGEIALLEREEYVGLVCDFLERLAPEIVVQRLTGEGGKELVAPAWSRAKFEVLNAIDREFERRGSRQGSCVVG